MMNAFFGGGLTGLPFLPHGRSRAINVENPTGEKGKGGMSASPLGDFFCCGFARECQVTSMPVSVIPNRGFNCYFRIV